MLRRADGLGARLCVVIGESEVEQDQVQLKDLTAHTQEQIPRAEAVARIVSTFASAATDSTRGSEH
jgi:histidyl-tRNA synthetase